mmetsp:Transcript_5991/g.15712  ORF Transcript_5991/g.15712 Transcript_5991/m.15712 type:complete len:373 (+) Transcript_5991:234-1352(+)
MTFVITGCVLLGSTWYSRAQLSQSCTFITAELGLASCSAIRTSGDMHALYTTTEPDGRSARMSVCTSSGVVACIAITSVSQPSASQRAVCSGEKRLNERPPERSERNSGSPGGAAAGAPSPPPAAATGVAASAAGSAPARPSKKLRTSSSGAEAMGAHSSSRRLSWCTPSSGTCGRAWAISSEPCPPSRCARAPATRPVPVSSTSTRAPARAQERAISSASESARSSWILSSLPLCAYTSHSSVGVGLTSCTTGVYFFAFFLRYLCCEKAVLLSKVAEFCAISRTISSPCRPCARSFAISAWPSACALPSSKRSLLVRFSSSPSAALAHSAKTPETSSARRSSTQTAPFSAVTTAPNGIPTRPMAGRRSLPT